MSLNSGGGGGVCLSLQMMQILSCSCSEDERFVNGHPSGTSGGGGARPCLEICFDE